MNQPLQEFIDSRGADLRVDDRAGVIRGVKILGLASRNGRRYLPAALENAVALYEGAKVNVNHPKGAANAPRDYQERIGVLRNVAFRETDADGHGGDDRGGNDRGGGLFGDLHYNPRHALAEQLAWDARHAPENVGLSHNVLAVTSRRGDETVVERIERVQSVDLVADPATTRGLFEAADGERAAVGEATAARAAWLAELSLDELQAARGDLVESLLESAASEIAMLRADVDRLRAEKMIAERRARLKTLLAEYELPDPDVDGPGSRAIVSDEFLRAALAAADEAALRRIVEERAALVRTARSGAASGRSNRATSREQTQVDTLLACGDAASFVKAIRR
ncbi:MAG: hypothetical protein DCC68_26935 [Planctomycetota bacterium]|nr:MAG: hypothetical protein DCC68_26935 [Planctomycetota bacterium]